MQPTDKSPAGALPCSSGAQCKWGPALRALHHCGYLDREQWAPQGRAIRKGPGPYVDVCPAWLAEQPAVCEAAQAVMALRANALGEVYPDAPNPVIEAALEGARAFNLFEAEQIQNAARRR